MKHFTGTLHDGRTTWCARIQRARDADPAFRQVVYRIRGLVCRDVYRLVPKPASDGTLAQAIADEAALYGRMA